MATLSLNVPDGNVARIVAAYEAEYGEKEQSESPTDFMKRIIGAQMNALLRNGEIRAASKQASDDFVEVPLS